MFSLSRLIAIASFLVFAFLIFDWMPAYADNSAEPEIFDVRKSFPLDPSEEVTHDFYINAGPEAGFRSGEYVTVVRQVPVHDPIQNKQQATLNVKIGRLHIIHVEHGITVGRLETEFDDDDRPVVEFESIMIGDRVDMTSISTDSSGQKKKGHKKAAEGDAPQAAAVPAQKVSEAPAPPAAEAPFVPLIKAIPANNPPSEVPKPQKDSKAAPQEPVQLTPNSAQSLLHNSRESA